MNLVVVQREAERVARHLGVADQVKVVWRRNCPDGKGRWNSRTIAHCHVTWNTRGTICLKESYFWGRKLQDIRSIVRHEVAHLVAQDHRTLAFQRAAHPHQKPVRHTKMYTVRDGNHFISGGIYQEMGKVGIVEVLNLGQAR